MLKNNKKRSKQCPTDSQMFEHWHISWPKKSVQYLWRTSFRIHADTSSFGLIWKEEVGRWMKIKYRTHRVVTKTYSNLVCTDFISISDKKMLSVNVCGLCQTNNWVWTTFYLDGNGCWSHPPDNSHKLMCIDIFLCCFIRGLNYKVNTGSEHTMGCNVSESEQAKREKDYPAIFSAISFLLRYNKQRNEGSNFVSLAPFARNWKCFVLERLNTLLKQSEHQTVKDCAALFIPKPSFHSKTSLRH